MFSYPYSGLTEIIFIREQVFHLQFKGRPKMPICEICGMEVVEVHECSECMAKFCDECGDVKRRLCYDCLNWEEGSLEETWEKVDDWYTAWDDDEPH